MTVLVAVVAAVALAGYLLPSGLAADDAMMAGQPDAMSSDGGSALPEYARYDADSIDSRVQAAVIGALRLYWAEGPAAFEMISPEEHIRTDAIYPFVLDAETFETVAHGAFPDFAGVIPDTLTRADSSVDRILADLERDGGTWAEYMATNPANGLIQPKRSWLYLHDGYIFGSGHYLPESEVKYTVEDAVRLYESKGQEAFEIITPEETLLVTELYPFIFNSTTLKTVAHGAIPDRLGHVPYSILNTGDRSIEEIVVDIQRDGGTWVEYVFTNPATETKQLKRSWLYLYDGYIFSSGYYLQDSRAQSLVAEAIILYKGSGQEAFDVITPEAVDIFLTLQPSFILDGETLEVLAHSLQPDLVGSTDQNLVAADKSLERIMEELQSKDGVWVWYMAQNPATLTDQLTYTYLSLHDGHIFGAGYSLPDSRVQSMGDEAVYTYRNDPESGFEVISSGTLNRLDLYPFAKNSTHLLAHGTASDPVRPLSITAKKPISDEDLYNAAVRGGGTVWFQLSFLNPYTGTEQIKRAVNIFYDSYIFGSTYAVPDADTRSAVDYAMFTYESNKENDAWIDIITPDEPVTTDDLYPFVIDAATWTRLADGVVPDRVGEPETILDTSIRSVEDVLADLEANGGTWVTYTFHNPSTGIEQLKRTYLQLRDGLVFGSGYYLLDTQVQAIAFGYVLDYNRYGDATLADINTIPEEPVSTYVFVVDPVAGTTQAQNVDPDLIGSTSDWDAISSDLQVDDILEKAVAEGGAWASYTFINPVTGETESKRTWLIINDGLVFGSGYYSSDIPESDVRFVVDSAIFTYESNKENDAWIDIITPDEPVTTDDLYPFVIDAATWTRLADGVVPDRVGEPETILDTSIRSVEDVLADLEANGGTWVTYTFHNPSTDTEQLKRTYLQLRDGLVFGSGYYLLDSQVQAAAYGKILEYNNKGRDAAFANINTIPEKPVPTYVFVVDPATGTTQAQNVDPDLMGSTSDWDAISSDLQVDDILNEIRRGTGMWVSYTLTNPVTGETEDKRTWLIMHDGLVFGSGYYTSG